MCIDNVAQQHMNVNIVMIKHDVGSHIGQHCDIFNVSDCNKIKH